MDGTYDKSDYLTDKMYALERRIDQVNDKMDARTESVWLAVSVEECFEPFHPPFSIEIIGVFSTESNAVEACSEVNHCVMPLRLDEIAPKPTTVCPNAYYPRA